MTTTVQFLFDFGSPNAYLAHKMLPALAQRTGATIDYVPVLLGGLFKLAHNRSPMEAYAQIPNKMAYEQLEFKRFVLTNGLSAFRFNPNFPVNTLQIMRGAVAAQGLGVMAPYVDAVYAAMWERKLNMADAEVIATVLTEAGLDAAAIAAGAADPQVKQQLMDNTQQACDRGAFGSPTFFVGDEMYFGKERLRDVEQMLLAQKA